MKPKPLSRFLTNGGRFEESSADYKRAEFLNFLLLFSLAAFMLYFLIGTIFIVIPEMTVLSVCGFAVAASILLFFHKTDNIQIAAFAAVFTLSIISLIFFVLRENNNQAFVFTMLAYPVAYFLLSRKAAHLFVAFYAGAVMLYTGLNYQNWAPAAFGLNSMVNLMVSTASIIMIINYYDKIRREGDKKLFQNLDELKKSEETIRQLSFHDQLTGLYNRLFLSEIIGGEFYRSERYREPLSLAIFDIDHFKRVNDQYGHLAGDQVLKEVADIAGKMVRESDFLIRTGGEEFLFILPQTRQDDAVITMERIRAKIAAHTFETVGRVTCSFGVAQRIPKEDFGRCFNRVDRAMYEAKKNGRNLVVGAEKIDER